MPPQISFVALSYITLPSCLSSFSSLGLLFLLQHPAYPFSTGLELTHCRATQDAMDPQHHQCQCPTIPAYHRPPAVREKKRDWQVGPPVLEYGMGVWTASRGVKRRMTTCITQIQNVITRYVPCALCLSHCSIRGVTVASLHCSPRKPSTTLLIRFYRYQCGRAD